MVSTCADHRDSLCETLFWVQAPQRRGTATATTSAETGKPAVARRENSSCGGSARKVRPNTSFNRTRYGRRRKPGLHHASYPCSPGLRRLP